MKSLRSAWSSEWRERSFRAESAVTLLLLVGTLMTLTRFLTRVEQRSGVVLPDPFLALFHPIDLTWVTFSLIYAGILGGIGVLLADPRRLLLTFQAYTAMVVIRIVAMGVTPLDPPATMIPLVDPTVYYLGTGVMLNKDLFFSGHTSTMFLLVLTAATGARKRMFLIATIAVAACVLLQHAHYTIDVVAAPFFAFGAFRLLLLVRSRIFHLTFRGESGT